jgi:DNA invertase Pin-like site-specific DNA recombinase
MSKRKTTVYCRSAIHDEVAVARQERQCREYAAGYGYEIVNTYRDCGESGPTLVRPALSELIADIKAGTIGAVNTQDTARIARNFALVSEWHELLHKNDVKRITLAGGDIDEYDNGLTYRQWEKVIANGGVSITLSKWQRP